MKQSLPNLPEAIETEKLVLGVLLGEPDAASTILTLDSQDFFIEQHKRIFEAARWLNENGQDITCNTVYQRLADTRHAESVGGLSYLIGLDAPHIYGLESYLGTLRIKSTLRRAAIAAHELSERCCMPGAELNDIRSAEMFLREIASRADRNVASLTGLSDLIDEHGGLDNFMRPDRSGAVPLPWNAMNSVLTGGGFLPGQLIILGARPGLGKSALAALIALGARDLGVAVFSLEMGANEIWFRMIASKANMPLKAITEGSLDDWTLRQGVHAAATELSEKPVYVDDTTGANVPAVVAAIRKRAGVRLVIIDYLQLLSPLRKRQSRAEEVSEISRALKLAARELRVPFLVLSQLSRSSAKDNRPPELQDLRESGSIEQDADIVMLLHAGPKELKEAIAAKRPNSLDLIIAKQRNGATGTVRMMFNPGNMQMWEVDQL